MSVLGNAARRWAEKHRPWRYNAALSEDTKELDIAVFIKVAGGYFVVMVMVYKEGEWGGYGTAKGTQLEGLVTTALQEIRQNSRGSD